MNRRLLLSLYDRAGLGAYMPVDLKGHELQVEEHMEKFAELIIRECLEQIYSVTIDNPTDDWDQGYDSGLEQAADTIKTHFEVSE